MLAQIIKNWVADKKIRAPELELENGSGLSRDERISPAHLAQLLQAAWRSAVFIALPIRSLAISPSPGSAFRFSAGSTGSTLRACSARALSSS